MEPLPQSGPGREAPAPFAIRSDSPPDSGGRGLLMAIGGADSGGAVIGGVVGGGERAGSTALPLGWAALADGAGAFGGVFRRAGDLAHGFAEADGLDGREVRGADRDLL